MGKLLATASITIKHVKDGQNGVDASNKERYDGLFADGIEYWSKNFNNYVKPDSNTTVITSTKQPKYGDKVLNIKNDTWLYAKNKISIKPNSIYRFIFRVRQETAATDNTKMQIYAGATEFNSSGAKISVNNGTYFVVSGTNIAPPTANQITAGDYKWLEYTVYMSTTAKNAITDSKGATLFPAVKAFTSGVSTIKPMFIVNYQGGNGTAQVDALIVEEVTDLYEVAVLQSRTSKLEVKDTEILAQVTKTETIVSKLGNPMSLGVKKEYSDFTSSNVGEFYLHGYDSNNKPADVNGSCMWPQTINGVQQLASTTLPKQMYNPNGKVPAKTPIYMVWDLTSGNWLSIWKTEVENTVTWHKMHANDSVDGNVYTFTWNANEINRYIFVGYYMTEKNISESPFLAVQLFKGALTYLEAINMSVTASYGQIKVLDNEISMKVDNDGVIAAINLYSQTDGSGSGVKISGNKIDLEGQVTFSSLAASGAGAIKSVFTTQGDTTVINGAMIKTGSIKANDLLIKGNLSIINNENKKTFSVDADGNVEVDGLLQSSNFDEHLALGYQISPAGTAILNQAVVKGDVILPSSGMTNYGGQIGNKNLVKNSDFSNGNSNWSFSIASVDKTKLFEGRPTLKLTRTGATTDTWNGAQQDIDIQGNANIKNQAFTVSFWYYIEDKSTIDTTIAVELKGKNANGNHISAGGYWSATKDTVVERKWTYVSYTFTPTSSDLDRLFIYPWIKRNGTVWFARFKVEKSNKATPWCPHPLEQLNNVRIWAGEKYENRDSAPFRVYENGDIVATNGTFNGRVLGHIDSKNIHIHEGQFVINSVTTFIDDDNQVASIAPMDAHPNPYMLLSAEKNFINTDIAFGTIEDSRIKYSNNNRILDVNCKANFNIGTTRLTCNSGTAWSDGIEFASRLTGNNGLVAMNFRGTSSSDANHMNTLYMVAKGGKGSTYGDFCMRRANWDEDFDLNVHGNVKIKTAISSELHGVQIKAVSNEGWGFYVV